MKRMLAISLIIVGLVSTGTGLWMLSQANNRSQESLEQLIAEAVKDAILTDEEESMIRREAYRLGEDSDLVIAKIKRDLAQANAESEEALVDINSKAGLDFEKYIVKKFDPQYFVIKQWAGDKFVEGRYAETTLEPDLQLELKLGKERYPVAVECKWRSEAKDSFIRFASDQQLERYKAFEKQRNMPTFIALGIGGQPDNPESLYIIPVSTFSKPVQHMANVSKYYKSVDKNFYFDHKESILR